MMCVQKTNPNERTQHGKTEKEQKKPKKVKPTDIEEYLKQLPHPPEEHAYELKMEKRLKRMLKEQEKKMPKKNPC